MGLALSLWQPWSSMVAMGAKKQETRSWKPPKEYDGCYIAIHATKTTHALGEIARPPFSTYWPWGAAALPLGAVIGIVRLSHVKEITDDMAAWLERHKPDEFAMGDYTPGRYAWMFSEAYELREPIPYKGGRKFFDVPEADQWRELIA